MALKTKRSGGGGGGSARILITVNVLGSAGPLRFLVNEDERVAAVIHTALRTYGREGRLPVLGTDLNNFFLYCAHTGYEALNPWEPIGSNGSRKFVLCKKPEDASTAEAQASSAIVRKGSGSGSWKTWINKSLSFVIPSH
ncbi:uncharacterized protein M6B38_339020 [Iris pallida]|uniref:DUF7054 domain-containing protein n=1 Tax=Iris pallida TaxID=29817 RepID=A0AAX6DJV4_IRIPA|nr:Uncharacterized protein M6B38_242925 [Iris pallida]KAJ6833827.1 uncharacterized protein M6B38_339020 [Iris pallida]